MSTYNYVPKIDFTSKTNKRQKGHHIIIKKSLHQKDITIGNFCPNIGIPKKNTKRIKKINSNMIVRDHSTLLSTMTRSSKKKRKKLIRKQQN